MATPPVEAAGIPPRPPALFVGRDAELARFASACRHVRLALIYGVGGVGKTAFMLRAAEDLARSTGARIVHHACREGESIASVAQAISDPIGGSASPHGGAIGALLAASADAPLIICVDDLHRADHDTGLVEALVYLARQRASLWICGTSREDLAVDPAQLDHLVLRLGGLSQGEAQRLWTELEQLYGQPHRRLDRAGRAGNPLLIKQAFASPSAPTEGDPMGLAAIPATAAEILSVASAFRTPAPLEWLAGDLSESERWVTELERRFLLERTAAGHYTVHDLVREEVHRSPLAPDRRAHRRCLDALLGSQPTAEREILFHAVACGDDERALTLLLGYTSPAVRALPPGTVVERDLADAIDRLAARLPLPMPVRLLRERLRSRRGDTAGAYRGIEALAASGDPLAVLDHAEIALTIGRTPEALASLAIVVDSDQLDPFSRMWAAVLLTIAHTARNEVGDARAGLDRISATGGVLGHAVRRACEGIIEADQEDYDGARRAFDDVRVASGSTAPLGFPLMASVDRIAATALGRPPLEEASDDDLFGDTFLFRIAARLLRVHQLQLLGRTREAAELGTAVVETAAGAGHGPLVWWGAHLLGEAQMTLASPGAIPALLRPHREAASAGGWNRAVVRMDAIIAAALLATGELDRAREVAQRALPDAAALPSTRARLKAVVMLAKAACGSARPAHARPAAAGDLEGHARHEWRLACAEAHLWAGRLSLARRDAAEAEATSGRAGWRLLECRARLLAAEASYRCGDGAAAQLALDAALRAARDEGYRSLRVRGALLAAALLRMREDAAGYRRELERCARDAEELGLGLELKAARLALAHRHDQPISQETPAARLAARLGLTSALTARLRDPRGSCVLTAEQLDALDGRRYELVVDLVERRVRSGRRNVDLSRNEALVRFLAVLAQSPGHVVSNEAIARALWGVEYHPLHHHSRLTVQATRLRKRVGAPMIAGDPGGYRLAAPSSWAVIERLGQRQRSSEADRGG